MYRTKVIKLVYGFVFKREKKTLSLRRRKQQWHPKPHTPQQNVEGDVLTVLQVCVMEVGSHRWRGIGTFFPRPVSAPEMNHYHESLTRLVFSGIFPGYRNVTMDCRVEFSVKYWTVEFMVSCLSTVQKSRNTYTYKNTYKCPCFVKIKLNY